jgi:NAD(P)H dehydrogenase (quinone)
MGYTMTAEVLVLYYSRYGSTAALAAQVVRGVNSVTGMGARLRTVPPVAARTTERLPDVPDAGPPYATQDDLGQCAGLILGSPTRFAHGGQESTLLSMMLPLLHHGMILVGVPYMEPALFSTRSGGTPYGASHVAYEQSETQLTDQEQRIARHLGQRVAEIALRLAPVR